MSIQTDVPGAKTSANGELINRVQQLRLDGQLGRGQGSSRGSWLPWVLCGMMAIAWAGVGVRWYRAPDASSDAAPSNGAAKSTGNGVSASNKPDSKPGELLLQIKGTLIPFLQINLSPDDVAGVVTEIFFKEGDRVKEGQLLARIRNNRYKNDYDGAKAALDSAQCRWDEMHPDNVREIEKEQARAELAEAEANQVRAKQDLERYTGTKASSVVSP